MRILNSVVVAGALLAFGGSAFAQAPSLGASRPDASEMKKHVEKKIEKKVEKKEEKTEDGAVKKEEKIEHTESGESAPSAGAENSTH